MAAIEFCNECESIMKQNSNEIWVCQSCGHEQESDSSSDDFITVSEQEESSTEIPDPDEDITGLPKTTDVKCDECATEEAYWYLQQTRAADESETRFYICTECDNRWRGYD